MANKKTFEENMEQLQTIVDNLEKGDVPLEKALEQFKSGVEISQKLQKTLDSAEETLTKVMNDQGEEIPLETKDSKADE